MSNFNLLFKFVDLLERIIELHLEVVTFEDYRFQMELLFSNDVAIQVLPPIHDLIDSLYIVLAACLNLWETLQTPVEDLERLRQVLLPHVSDVCDFVHLLL